MTEQTSPTFFQRLTPSVGTPKYIGPSYDDIKKTTIAAYQEIKYECTPTFEWAKGVHPSDLLKYVHIPWLPAFWRPGWFKNYVLGPYTPELLDSFFADIWAGVIVAMTLLPQGLSYGQLANLPSYVGLYTAILPSATYTFLGTSMVLGVGPVAVVSLIVGKLVTENVPNYATNTALAIDFAAQVSIACGVYLVALGIFKLGNLIDLISLPVMSGFTSGAAMGIGLSQVKSAFGFQSNCPQVGQVGYEYQYEVMKWFTENWNGYSLKAPTGSKVKVRFEYINPYAVKICFGLFIPLFFLQIIKLNIPATAERKKLIWFRVVTFIINIMPLFAIIIGANVAKKIITHAKSDDIYAQQLKVIGILPKGVNILRSPNIEFEWGKIFEISLPLTLIMYMESYSVARKLAANRNELHILNANQEMFAVGVGNLLGSIATAYPVAGSFSRSSLNAASGARTPLSKAVTMSIICIALASLTEQFQYIPQAALAAIIWIAISALISPQDVWLAWKHSKSDFFVIATTLTLTFVLNTEYGLAAGIGLSFVVWFIETYRHQRVATEFSPAEEKAFASGQADDYAHHVGVEYIRLNTDITFVTGSRLKTTLYDDVIEKKSGSLVSILLDLSEVFFVDLTGLRDLNEIVQFAHLKGILIGHVNAKPHILAKLNKFEIPFDSFEAINNSDGKVKTLIPVKY